MSTLKLQVKEFQNQISLSFNAQENETIIAANSYVLKRLNKSLVDLTSKKVKFKKFWMSSITRTSVYCM